MNNRQSSAGGGHRRIVFNHSFEDIISLENLLNSWQQFTKGKRKRKDVQEFGLNLMDNIFSLYKNLANFSYKHGEYKAFNINDPKPRNIHKATVQDRLLHHAVYRLLYPFFDHRVLRTTTKRRMVKKVEQNPGLETTNSYLGLLKHGNAHKLADKITKIC